MELAPDRCYEALRSRDGRFDGRFFVGVTTTGIFCRPVCPARTPRRANVRFFPCAAAAAEAGFRPCRRCRPERAPGTPAWLGTSTTVRRALRLIAAGVIDREGVDALAARLGIGARQLRRLFHRHLGVGPLAIAHAERAHFARRLLDDTDLAMSEVAWTAGFRSIRQFNHAMRDLFGEPPTALRQRRRPQPAAAPVLRLRLAYRAPYDWEGVVAHLRARATPGLEAVDDAGYHRAVASSAAAGTVTVRHDPGQRGVELLIPVALAHDAPSLVASTRRLFDLDADPLHIGSHLARDARLAPLVRRHPGLRLPGAWDPFELGVRAILGQQVSVAAATTLMGRLVRAVGRPVATGDDRLTHVFPSAATLRTTDLGGLGIAGGRMRAIGGLAAAVDDGALPLDGSLAEDDVTARLVALSGIGPWTATYIALRALGEPDAFPAADLGLRRAWGNGHGPVAARDLERAAERWRPWRGYAAALLWKEGTRT